VNTGLSTAGLVWNLRSALNVAALNCQESHFAGILPAYRVFLDKNESKLARVNKEVDEEFRKVHGARTYRTERDQYMTQVYNYFALPPAHHDFCETATAITARYMAESPADLDAFSAVALTELEQVFLDFYNQFDAQVLAAADWDRQYGALYGATQPGYVATAMALPSAGSLDISTLPSASGVTFVPGTTGASPTSGGLAVQP
jgi:hypothetical protein